MKRSVLTCKKSDHISMSMIKQIVMLQQQKEKEKKEKYSSKSRQQKHTSLKMKEKQIKTEKISSHFFKILTFSNMKKSITNIL